jgi:hypothetical protein
MKFTEYKHFFDIGKYPDEWRRGQTAFNFVFDTYPDIANELRATEFDPFYNDSRLPAFWEQVEKLYKEQVEKD